MGVLERDWAREDARRREQLPHVPVAMRPITSAVLGRAEAACWLIFLLGLVVLFGPLLAGFGGLALGLIPGDAAMPTWLVRSMVTGTALCLLGGLPASVLAKLRED